MPAGIREAKGAKGRSVGVPPGLPLNGLAADPDEVLATAAVEGGVESRTRPLIGGGVRAACIPRRTEPGASGSLKLWRWCLDVALLLAV